MEPRQCLRFLSKVATRCFMYTPVAMNSAPSFIMAHRTFSPSRSTSVTPFKSTTRLTCPFAAALFFQLDRSCATHGPEILPCKTHRCSEGSSTIVILSTATSPACEYATLVPKLRFGDAGQQSQDK